MGLESGQRGILAQGNDGIIWGIHAYERLKGSCPARHPAALYGGKATGTQERTLWGLPGKFTGQPKKEKKSKLTKKVPQKKQSGEEGHGTFKKE